MGCCSPGAFDDVFSERQARKDLRRYRRRGLKRDQRDALAFLRSHGLDGATVLEVGGGVGALQLELLRAGAARAVDVELSPGYEPVAAELLAGYEDRVERRIGDFAAATGERVDAVVGIRVVCCYPDPERLVGVAAATARRLLVLTFPTDSLVARAVAAGARLILRLAGSEFRPFAYRHARIARAAEAQGLRLVHHRRGLVWHVAGFERFPAGDTGQADDMTEHRDEPDREAAERAEEATEESRRERGDRRIEEQEGLGAGRDDDGKPRPF